MLDEQEGCEQTYHKEQTETKTSDRQGEAKHIFAQATGGGKVARNPKKHNKKTVRSEMKVP